jgi:stage II sporulation protein R
MKIKKHSIKYDFLAVGIALLISFAFTFAISFSGFAAESAYIRAKTLRLHILANSDTAEDQALKLAVRDRIIAETGELFSANLAREDAKEQIRQRMPQIQRIAMDEIARHGYNYSVNIELVNMFFTTRTYDGVTLPAGKYDALRVVIGAGEGQNWWCVLYPPLCLPAAGGSIEEVLDEGERGVVESSPKYEVRFKVVELWEGLFG